jgi:hypothetical protein
MSIISVFWTMARQSLICRFFKVDWCDDYREGPFMRVWPEKDANSNSDEEEESDESTDCMDRITLKYQPERYRVYLAVLSVDVCHIQILRSYEERESVEKFAERQYYALNHEAPFRSNGETTSAGHPQGERVFRYKHRRRLAWNKDLIEDDDNSALLVIDGGGSVTTYSLDYNSVWE